MMRLRRTSFHIQNSITENLQSTMVRLRPIRLAPQSAALPTFTIHYGEIKTTLMQQNCHVHGDLQSTMVRLRRGNETLIDIVYEIYNPLW